MSVSCKDCLDRYVGCHSKCEKYAQFKKEREQMKKNRNLSSQYLYYIGDKNRVRKNS